MQSLHRFSIIESGGRIERKNITRLLQRKERKEKMNKQELERRLSRKIKNLQVWFEPYAEAWKKETDDRGLFAVMYYDIIDTLEQLKQLNECSEYLLFEVILPKINEDKRTLEEIRNHFVYKD